MTRLDTSFPAFDPALQPIGYALATELLEPEPAPSRSVVVQLPAPAVDSSVVGWFTPIGLPDEEFDGPVHQQQQQKAS